MDKQLAKLYIVILSAAVLAVIFLPSIVGRMSAWASDAATEARLMAYQAGGSPCKTPDSEKGNVIIVMDDGYETQYSCGFKVLRSYGMRACIAVIPAAVGDPGYMDYQQMAELHMAGWDMLNHTYNHTDLSAMTKEEQAEQIKGGMDWLRGHHLIRGSDILVYPGGQFTDTTKEVMKEAGVKAARSLKSIWSADLDCTLENADICNVSSDLPFEYIKTAIDKAADNCSSVTLLFHKIEPMTDNTQMQIEKEKFTQIVEYISSRKDALSIITLSELIS